MFSQNILRKLDDAMHAALRSPFGVAIRTNRPRAVRNHVLQLRKELVSRGFAEFEDLKPIPSPDEPKEGIWIIRRSKIYGASDASKE